MDSRPSAPIWWWSWSALQMGRRPCAARWPPTWPMEPVWVGCCCRKAARWRCGRQGQPKQPPLPAKLSALFDQELTLGDAWLEVFQQVLPRNQFCAAGKLVARAYREEFGEEPPRRQQFVDGAPRQVQSYRRSWLIDTLKRFRAELTGG